MFDISLTGDKRTARKLKKMDKKLARKIMRQALKDAMEPVKVLAKNRAPVDTGLLRRSIRTAASVNQKRAAAFVRTGTRKQLRIPLDADYYYPAGIEYGTRKTPARSFLRSALGNLRHSVLRKVGENIRRLLETTR